MMRIPIFKRIQPFIVAIGLFLMIFFASSGAKVFVLFLPYFNRLGIPMSQLGLMTVAFSALIFLISTFAGKIYQRFGMKQSMIVGVLSAGSSFFLMGLIPTPLSLFCALALIAVGTGLAGYVPASLIINRWFKTNRGLVVALVFMGMSLGGSFYGMVYGSIQKIYNETYGMMAIGTISIVMGCLVVLFLIVESPEKAKAQAFDKGVGNNQTKNDGLCIAINPKEANRSSLFIAILLITFVSSGVVSVIQAYLPTHWGLIGISDFDASRLFATMMVIGSVASIIGGFIADRYSGSVFVAYSTVMLIASTLIVLTFKDIGAMYIAAILMGVAYLLCSITPSILLSETFDQASYSQLIGFIQGVTFFSMAILFPLCGVFYDQYGGFREAFSMMLAMTGLIGIMLIVYIRGRNAVKDIAVENIKG